MTRLRLVLGLILLLLGLAGCGPDKGQAFVNEYRIATNTAKYDAKDGYTAELKQFIKPQKAKGFTWQIGYFEAHNCPETRALTFFDPHAGDREAGNFVYVPARHEVTLSYFFNDAEEDVAAHTKGKVSMVYAASGRHTLTLKKQKVEVTGPRFTKKTLLARAQPYVQSMRAVFSDVLDFGTADAVTKALKKAVPKQAQKDRTRVSSWRQAESKLSSHRDQTFWPATFAPAFTDAQWRQAILARAQTLGIKGATVSLNAYGNGWKWQNFDRHVATGFTSTAEYYRWNANKPPIGYTYNRFTGNSRREGVYLITDQDGIEYLVILPIRLYTDQYLKAHNNLKDRRDGQNLTSSSTSYMIEANFVKAKATPTASEIANNIRVAKALPNTPKMRDGATQP